MFKSLVILFCVAFMAEYLDLEVLTDAWWVFVISANLMLNLICYKSIKEKGMKIKFPPNPAQTVSQLQDHADQLFQDMREDGSLDTCELCECSRGSRDKLVVNFLLASFNHDVSYGSCFPITRELAEEMQENPLVFVSDKSIFDSHSLKEIKDKIYQ